MPSESPRSEHDDSFDETPPLTDEDVAILYQIIRSAEQYPEVESHPFRAIFSAYDRVLPENGLDSNHDQVYLRFLFILGDRRENGDPLFETFEKLLEELGIQIEFNSEEGDIQEVTRNLAASGDEIGEDTQNFAESSRHARRRSTHLAYEGMDESAGIIQSPTDSRASVSRLQISKRAGTNVRPASRATTRPTERTSNSTTPRKTSRSIARKRLTAREWTQDLEKRQRERTFLRYQKHGQLNDNFVDSSRRLSLKNTDPRLGELLSDDTDQEEIPAQSRNRDPLEHFPFVLNTEEKFYSPSRTQLLRDAETFQSYRIRSVARDAVEKWCYAAIKAKDQHEYMQRVAFAHDKEILLRQAFEHWCLRLHERQQAVQTKRYFQHLERRAMRARDLYLLTKAFTHWVQCARDEALRLSLARQHILSVKYFNAWRDLTIANQNKVHYHGLRRYLDIWRRRYVQNVTYDVKAELAHQRYLIRSAYWHWFWGFCEARAPEWQARRLKQRTLMKWLAAFRMNRRSNQQVTLHIEIAAKRFFLSQWLDKARKMLYSHSVAATYSRQMLTAKALTTWIRVHRHGPLLLQLSNMVDWRVARAKFAIVVNRYRKQKQAESLDQIRVKRIAWTRWNDHLRWQTLARLVDDRCLLEALYKWTIAGRLKLFTRLFQGRLKERYLLTLREVLAKRDRQRNEIFRTVDSHLARRSLHLVISNWRLSCQTLQQNERIATYFHGPRVMNEAFRLLNQRFQQIEELNKKGSYAADYFMAKHSISRWRAAFVTSKRQKRLIAYIQVRRKTKMRLATETLQSWHSAAEMVRDMKVEAHRFDHGRVLRIVAGLFNRWKVSYDQATERHFQATSNFEEHLLLRQFRIWSDRTSELTELERTALQNTHLHRQSLALMCLNRLRLRLIELKGPQATAQNLRIRYEKRHFYNMLRLWQEQAAYRLNRPLRDRAIFSAKARRTRLLSHGDDRFCATARAEEWAELDQGEWIAQLEAESDTTPLPGNLSTPSKRAARVRAMIRESTTPLGTPSQTKLRAQLNATPRTTQRALFGRSIETRKIYPPAPPGDGSGSTTVVGRDD